MRNKIRGTSTIAACAAGKELMSDPPGPPDLRQPYVDQRWTNMDMRHPSRHSTDLRYGSRKARVKPGHTRASRELNLPGPKPVDDALPLSARPC